MSVAPPSPSSTVVLLRAQAPDARPELLLLKRQAKASWLGGAWVFPGGRVDDGDREPAWEELAVGHRELSEAWPQVDASWLRDHAVAAVRELFEETGLLLADTIVDEKEGEPVIRPGPGRAQQERQQLIEGLADFASLCARRQWRLRLDLVVPFARWITPESERRRFDTVFFVSEASEWAFAPHPGEMSAHAWTTACAALDRFARRQIALAPPTLRTLEDLRASETLSDAVAWARTAPRLVIAPRLHEDDTGRFLLLPGDPLYPAPSTGPVAPPTRFVFDQDRWRSDT